MSKEILDSSLFKCQGICQNLHDIEYCLIRCSIEIKMWRKRYIAENFTLYTDSKEEKFFEDSLINYSAGIDDIKEFEEEQLRSYRDTLE